jgi:branched-chain amino acid aminotransferase
MLASVDGSIGPAEEARIPVPDEGLTRGDGGFEVMRLYGGRPFALDDHLARLRRTCAGLRLEYDEDAVRAEVAALLEAAGPVEALLRVVLTRGARRILTIEPLPPRPAVPAGAFALGHAAVAAEARGRGVGQALTLAGLALARERGATVTWCDWRLTNMDAEPYWRTYGWTPYNVRYTRRVEPDPD